MKRLQNTYVTRHILAFLAAVVLLLVAGAIVVSTFAEGTVHALTIGYSALQEGRYIDVQAANFTGYHYGMSGDLEEGEPRVYRIHDKLLPVLDELDFPLESSVMKAQLLDALEGKTLVQFYDVGDGGTGCEACQALVVSDWETGELFVVGLNSHNEDHTFRIKAERTADYNAGFYDITLYQQAARLEQNLTLDGLEALLAGADADVEVVDSGKYVPEEEEEDTPSLPEDNGEEESDTKDTSQDRQGSGQDGDSSSGEEEQPGDGKPDTGEEDTPKDPDSENGDGGEEESDPGNGERDENDAGDMGNPGIGDESGNDNGDPGGEEQQEENDRNETADDDDGGETGGGDEGGGDAPAQPVNARASRIPTPAPLLAGRPLSTGKPLAAPLAAARSELRDDTGYPGPSLFDFIPDEEPEIPGPSIFDRMGDEVEETRETQERIPTEDNGEESGESEDKKEEAGKEQKQQNDQSSIFENTPGQPPTVMPREGEGGSMPENEERENGAMVVAETRENAESNASGELLPGEPVSWTPPKRKPRLIFTVGVDTAAGQGRRAKRSLGFSDDGEEQEAYSAIVINNREETLASGEEQIKDELIFTAPQYGVSIAKMAVAADETVYVNTSDAFLSAIEGAADESGTLTVALQSNIYLTRNANAYLRRSIHIKSSSTTTRYIYPPTEYMALNIAVSSGTSGKVLSFDNVVIDGRNGGAGIYTYTYRRSEEYDYSIGYITIRGAVVQNCNFTAGKYHDPPGSGSINTFINKYKIRGVAGLIPASSAGGGGIYLGNMTRRANSTGSPNRLENCVLRNNATQSDGAAVFCSGMIVEYQGSNQVTVGTGEHYLTNCQFIGNNAGDEGGGIFGGGGSAVTVRDCTFTNNNAAQGACITVDNNTFISEGTNTYTNNTARRAGGILAYGGTYTVKGNDVFTGNKATGTAADSVRGGGAILLQGETMNVESGATVSMKGGEAAYQGGGLYLWQATMNIGGTVTIGGTGDSEKNRTPNSGGAGIAVFGSNSIINGTNSNATLNIIGNETGTTAGGNRGGGIHINGNISLTFGGTIKVNITGNSALFGGGISVGNGAVFQTNNSTATITIENNKALTSSGVGGSGSGGGIHVRDKGTLDMSANDTLLIKDNTAALHGGGVFVEEQADASGTVSTLWLEQGKIEFVHNIATGRGGGLYMASGNAHMAGITLKDNEANNGGGVYQSGTSNITFYNNGSSILVDNNKASNNGAGIYLENATVKVSGPATFSNNKAGNQGGGLYTDNGKLDIQGTLTTTGNSAQNQGGGWHLKNSTVSVTGTAVIANNTPALSGAGISVEASTSSTINGSGTAKISITDNTANDWGGGVYVDDNATLNLTGTQEMVVSKNKALYGGGIAVSNSAKVLADNNSSTVLTLTVEDNEALTASGVSNSGRGGGIFVRPDGQFTIGSTDIIQVKGNTANLHGGGFFTARGANVRLDGNRVEIQGNRATEDGGGCYASGSAITMKDCDVGDNHANIGGGFCLYDNSGNRATLTITGSNAKVTNNTAISNGGGIFLSASDLAVTGSNAEISGNTTNANGGGVFLRGSTMNINGGNAKIDNNKSLINLGGGIYATGANTKVEINNGTLSMTGNLANQGGAVYMASQSQFTAGKGSNLDISGNIAHNSAGAMYLNGATTTISCKADFNRNTAGIYGGAIQIQEGAMTIAGESAAPVTVNIKENWLKNENGNDTEAYGGGIYLADSGIAINISNATVNVSENWVAPQAEDAVIPVTMGGGGIGFDESAAGTIAVGSGGRLNVTDNSAPYGGGLYLRDGSGTVAMNGTASGSVNISGNGSKSVQVPASGRGIMALAVSAADDDPVSITCEYGGGVYIGEGKKLTLANASLSENEAVFGGGAFIAKQEITGTSAETYTSAGGLSATNTDIEKNTAEKDGGGVYVTLSDDVDLELDSIYKVTENARQYAALFLEGASRFGGNTAQSYSKWDHTRYTIPYMGEFKAVAAGVLQKKIQVSVLSQAADGTQLDNAYNNLDVNSRIEDVPQVNVTLRKVDALDNQKRLDGATFKIYGCNQTHTHDKYTGAGSCWTEEIATATSDSNGLLAFGMIPVGTYQLVEMTVPNGYAVPAGEWLIEVKLVDNKLELNATVQAGFGSAVYAFIDTAGPGYSGNEDTLARYWIPNREKTSLPFTGSSWYFGFSAAAMTILTSILIFKRYKHGR